MAPCQDAISGIFVQPTLEFMKKIKHGRRVEFKVGDPPGPAPRSPPPPTIIVVLLTNFLDIIQLQAGRGDLCLSLCIWSCMKKVINFVHFFGDITFL
jgi:hypothetical protein